MIGINTIQNVFVWMIYNEKLQVFFRFLDNNNNI